ncbi:hypothetical protein P7K49_018907 [Saguinus oedipus]|uniref:Uncharacterized protein n=1 Tax=Saguinus oedipus TaxID=9490 RepID=A0ABQ9UWM4_SAGOE|nr:hypothetical protein P7K49_018907 [Saguinus oedipus]
MAPSRLQLGLRAAYSGVSSVAGFSVFLVWTVVYGQPGTAAMGGLAGTRGAGRGAGVGSCSRTLLPSGASPGSGWGVDSKTTVGGRGPARARAPGHSRCLHPGVPTARGCLGTDPPRRRGHRSRHVACRPTIVSPPRTRDAGPLLPQTHVRARRSLPRRAEKEAVGRDEGWGGWASPPPPSSADPLPGEPWAQTHREDRAGISHKLDILFPPTSVPFCRPSPAAPRPRSAALRSPAAPSVPQGGKGKHRRGDRRSGLSTFGHAV